MLTRFHKILIGLLAAQVLLAILTLTRGGDSAALRPTPILAGFDPAKVTHLTVFGADASKPAVELARNATGWLVASSFDYPADPAKLDAVLKPLAKAAAAEPIATQPARHNQLRVGETEYERKLVVTADGKPITIFIGASRGNRRNAIRIGGDDRVYAVSDVSPYSIGSDVRSWIKADYVEVPRADIAKITIQHDATSVELVHGEPDTWTATISGAAIALGTGETVDGQAIEQLVTDAATIDAAAPADPKKDAAKPVATITIDHKAAGTSSKAPDVIDIVADGASYWVHQRGLERAVMVDKARLERVVAVDRDKLVKKPPAPASGSGSGSGAGHAAAPPPPPLPLEP
jgi:hypothetical protein